MYHSHPIQVVNIGWHDCWRHVVPFRVEHTLVSTHRFVIFWTSVSWLVCLLVVLNMMMLCPMSKHEEKVIIIKSSSVGIIQTWFEVLADSNHTAFVRTKVDRFVVQLTIRTMDIVFFATNFFGYRFETTWVTDNTRIHLQNTHMTLYVWNGYKTWYGNFGYL